MPTDGLKLGICKTAACVAAGNGPVELYEGPGTYCPACGTLLQPYVSEKLPSAPPKVPAWAAPDAQPSPAPGPRLKSGLLIVAGGAIVAFAVLWTIGLGPFGHNAAGVCASSMAERVARDVLHGYDVQNRDRAAHFQLRTTGCEVRFSADLNDRPRSSIIGLDGVVAIVNPTNPVGRMSLEQLHNILAGTLTNWSSVGGRSQPIVVYLPADSTDEAHVVAIRIMLGAAVGTSVVRVPSSADVVRAVAAANGSNAIGLVAFSAAVPGKVVAVQEFPTPSVLSIGNGRYPLSVAVTVASDDSARDAAVSSLLTYAGSDGAKAIAERDGIITEGAIR